MSGAGAARTRRRGLSRSRSGGGTAGRPYHPASCRAGLGRHAAACSLCPPGPRTGCGTTCCWSASPPLLAIAGSIPVPITPRPWRLSGRGPGEPLPAFDVQLPLFSLPRLLGTTSLDRIPADVPYLRCDPELVEALAGMARVNRVRTGERARHAPALSLSRTRLTPLRVGIAWQGSPSSHGRPVAFRAAGNSSRL